MPLAGIKARSHCWKASRPSLAPGGVPFAVKIHLLQDEIALQLRKVAAVDGRNPSGGQQHIKRLGERFAAAGAVAAESDFWLGNARWCWLGFFAVSSLAVSSLRVDWPGPLAESATPWR